MKDRKNVYESKEAEGLRVKLDQLKIEHANGKINKTQYN